MNMMKKLSFIFLIGIVLVAMGCSNAEMSNTDSSVEQDELAMGSDSVDLIDDLGHEVTIPNAPQRVIAPYVEDDLLTLDIMPIVQWSVHDGASIQDYLQDQ